MKPLQILLNLRRNVLVFQLSAHGGEPAAWQPLPATIDIGEAGRLIGVEVDLSATPTLASPWKSSSLPPGEYDPETHMLYVGLEATAGDLTRTARATARGGVDRAGHLISVEIPRRGEGFEISYPSGNQ